MFDETQDNFKRLEEVFGMHSRQIIFWTGAGLSAPADLPTWADFLDKIVRRSEKLLNEVQYSEKELAHKQSLIKLAKVGTNFWKNFSLLHEVLEESTYAETVRSIFRSAERCPVPENYFAILDLHPTGIITTNIDRLVIRAHSESKTKHRLHGTPLVFNGTDCKDFMYALAGTRFFILNLHGVFEKRSSWCFRSEELSSLMSDQYYKQFIDTCFTSKAVVFVGATIDDVSIKAHLDRTRKDNPSDNVSLFWLTPDRSQTTRAFCEQYNVLPIYYDPSNDHSDLKDIFVRLKAYCPSDERIERPVVPPKSTSEKSVRNFDEINLSGLTLNELRKVLNRKAQSII
jgi:NAD-dependent SIR2 family protein deacetylase